MLKKLHYMLKKLRRRIFKMFREFLVYHSSSLEFRAKILTLIVASDHKISECDDKLLAKVAHKIYENNRYRAELLIDTVNEYFVKIKTNNGLDFEHLIMQVEKDARMTKRYVKKIDIDILNEFADCLESEDDKIFHKRIIEFLEGLKREYGTV